VDSTQGNAVLNAAPQQDVSATSSTRRAEAASVNDQILDRLQIRLSCIPPRRFPPPWSVEETDACFIVRDASRLLLEIDVGANGQALDQPLARDEAHERRQDMLDLCS
jgi:hypothetical protein